jgi:hypothetical protein
MGRHFYSFNFYYIRATLYELSNAEFIQWWLHHM